MQSVAEQWKEIARLGATNPRLFAKAYFPRTFRDPFPPFFERMWAPIQSPAVRYFNAQMYRGSSKTTNVRVAAAQRIAYATSRTILIICASQGKASKTIQWLASQITRNAAFATSFALRPDRPWSSDEIRIYHEAENCYITVIGMGIHGSVRGLNIEDYRPDFILIDDVLDDETAASSVQRKKLEDLILGAVAKSLATKTDNPNAKMVVLQTPFHHEDFSMKAFTDPLWYSIRQGCWTRGTENLAVHEQMSAWEDRFPTADLRQDKLGHIARNVSSIFAREMECKLVTPETSAFRSDWIQFYDEGNCPPLNQMYVKMAIDPVPPPTEKEIEQGMHKKNYEVLGCVGYHQGKYYVLEYRFNRGHDPNWTVANFFELLHKWRPKAVSVETHGYQATLSFLLKQAMASQGRYIPIEEERDKRSKFDKIVDPLKGPLSHRKLYLHPGMFELIAAITDYPNVAFDDIIECIAKAVHSLFGSELYDSDFSNYEEEHYGQLEYAGTSP